MKNSVPKISFLVILLVADSHCGVIDRIIGTVTNTTHGVKQDIKNVWSYSKSKVFGEDSNSKPKEFEQGLIGGWIHTAKEKMHTVHAYIFSDVEIPSDRGFFSKMYNRVKNTLSNIKGLIFGKSDVNAITTNTPQSEEGKLVKTTLDKLFFENGTKKVDENYFKETIANLKRKLIDLRNNLTDLTPRIPVEDAQIDVRGAADAVSENFDEIHNIDIGLANDVYDRVEQTVNKVSKVKKRVNEVRENRIGNFETESSKKR